MELTDKKLVMILLRRNNAPILTGITRIEKLAYLTTLSPEFSDLALKLNFEPLHYGPYSEKIVLAIDALETHNFINSRSVTFERQISERADEEVIESLGETKDFIETKSYFLSDAGKQVADYYFKQLSPEQQREIDNIISKYGGLPLKKLLTEVYSKAPEFLLRKSKIREEIGI